MVNFVPQITRIIMLVSPIRFSFNNFFSDQNFKFIIPNKIISAKSVPPFLNKMFIKWCDPRFVLRTHRNMVNREFIHTMRNLIMKIRAFLVNRTVRVINF